MSIDKKKNALIVAKRLEKRYPEAQCSLEYKEDPWKLLVMSRLSAQCTDARVNIVSKELFEKYPDVYSMAEAETEDIEKYIFSCGLYKTKARDLSKMCKQIIENFDGKVPDNMKDLLSLAGVGRKIANLMLGDVFGKGGIVADTHCIRITGKLGLVESSNQTVVERELDKIVPKDMQTDFCHRLVHFGREVCTARNPACSECFLCDVCPSCEKDKNKKAR